MRARTQVRSLSSGDLWVPSPLGSNGHLGPSPLSSGGPLGSSWILTEWQIALLNYFDGTWVKESSANTKAN